MSLVYLQNVLKTRGSQNPVKALVVSHDLFMELYQAADLRPKRRRWPAPADPACRKVINAWLKTEGLPPADQLSSVSWHLVWYGGLKVLRDTDLGLALSAEGPGSFELL